MHKIPYRLRFIHSKYMKYTLVLVNYINMIKIDACYHLNYILPSFKIMRIALLVLLLKKHDNIHPLHLPITDNLKHISKIL